MDSPGLVILSILAVGAVFVVLPVALAAFSEHRGPRAVVCPEAGVPATIEMDAGKATRGAIFGRPRLAVESCSLWPERQGCAQACLPSLAEEPTDPAESAGGFQA